MNTNTVLVAMMIFGAIYGSLMMGAPAKADPSMACASGYYTDAMGNCQPINGYVDSRRPNGFIAGPAPNGNDYRCFSEPRIY
jgi:hypothetical protein